MERSLLIQEAAEKSTELRDTLTLIQDAETRIKQVIFHSFLTNGSVEAIILRLIEETMKDLPESEDKAKYGEDLKANANHWLMVARYTNAVLEKAQTSKPEVVMPLQVDGQTDEDAYRRVAVMFEKGQPRQENYFAEALMATKQLASEMAGEPFRSSRVEFRGLEVKTNISIRAAAERRIRDQIHQAENSKITAVNRFIWISGHADCSKRCQPWQSRLYSTDGTSGTLEGHKYVPIEEATESNWVTTKTGKRWNNSILEGFNCRHYVIPFVPGTVPAIKYDPKIVERERAITERMRVMEQEIVKGKTLHKLLIEAERDNRLGIPRHQVVIAKANVRERYLAMNEKYQAFCHANQRAYYSWRTQILVDRSAGSKNIED
jgi:hypothetical protein